MALNGSQLDEIINQFAHRLSPQSATARAMDRQEAEIIATNVFDGGDIDLAVALYCLVQWTSLKVVKNAYFGGSHEVVPLAQDCLQH